MSPYNVAFTAIFVALATFMLSACGPDDGTSSSNAQSNAANNAAANAGTNLSASAATSSAQQTNPALMPPAMIGALGALGALGASGASATLTNAPAAAPDLAVQNVEASLAADSQQVAPVLHYAPGDSDHGDQNSTSN